MVSTQKFAALTLSFFILISGASAISFNVEVEDLTGHNKVEGFYFEQVGSEQKYNTTIENTGSIGCKYRIKANYNLTDITNSSKVDTVWSEARSLWPGQSAVLNTNYVAYNYTGNVDSEVYAVYCDQEKLIETFNFTVEEQTVSNNTIDLEKENVNSSMAQVRLGIDSGRIVPMNAPSTWKLSSAQIDSGRANLKYEPSLFNPDRDLEYLVIDKEGDALGTTSINLEYEPSMLQKAEQNIVEIVLGLSIITNLIFLLLLARLKSFKRE